MSLPTGRSSGFDGPLARVTAWLRTQPGVDATRLGLVGHSMGAGAVLRFALRDADIGATVAISTGLGPRGPVEADVPRNVLTIAGAWEFPNVLDACRAAVTASYPTADPAERQGSWADGTSRQCTVVPGVEHISVCSAERPRRRRFVGSTARSARIRRDDQSPPHPDDPGTVASRSVRRLLPPPRRDVVPAPPHPSERPTPQP